MLDKTLDMVYNSGAPLPLGEAVVAPDRLNSRVCAAAATSRPSRALVTARREK